MKVLVLLVGLLTGIISVSISQQAFSPYYKVAEFDYGVEEVARKVKGAIQSGGFEIIGEYNPAGKENLKVICFTNDELGELSLEFKDRGALASVLKAGIINNDGKTTLTIVNPEYMFFAYWGKQMSKDQEPELTKISESVKTMFSSLGKLTAFGGEIDKDDLVKYHYKMMMPYFDDPDELAEFSSFAEGLEIIRDNLNNGKGNTLKVYEQIFTESNVAVFGVGLMNKEDGEAHFLPIIGEEHIANMPYEIILKGKQATMLAGKYRIALYWPNLTMGTFMKIMSTPGDIEDTMESLCEE